MRVRMGHVFLCDCVYSVHDLSNKFSGLRLFAIDSIGKCICENTLHLCWCFCFCFSLCCFYFFRWAHAQCYAVIWRIEWKHQRRKQPAATTRTYRFFFGRWFMHVYWRLVMISYCAISTHVQCCALECFSRLRLTFLPSAMCEQN